VKIRRSKPLSTEVDKYKGFLGYLSVSYYFKVVINNIFIEEKNSILDWLKKGYEIAYLIGRVEEV